MKKGNIIELVGFKEKHDAKHSSLNSTISEELRIAIQHLILRLRELGPIQ